jgi:uncharacterized protein
MRFIWDPAKAALNYAKHGVSFGEALTAFDDPTGLYVPDNGHPERGNLIGHDASTKLLFVVHVELLSESPPATRIISARRANGPERDRYRAQFEPSKSRGRRPRRPSRERRSSRPLQPKKIRHPHEEE